MTTMQVTHKDLEGLLVHAYNRGLSVMVEGAPGIGKSDTLKVAAGKLAKQLKGEGKLKTDEVAVWPEFDVDKFNVIDVRLSQLDAVDVRGLPSEKDGKLTWLPPDFLSLPEGAFGILWLDEINLAPPMIQAAGYSLIYDRRAGNAVLPQGFGVMAAGNRAEDQAAVYQMAKPLCNRFLHVQLGVPSADGWVEWGISNGIDGRVLGYIEQNPQMLYQFDTDPNTKAFPTPRSWAFASRMIVGVENWTEVQFLTSTAVGTPAGHGLAAFAKLVETIDLDSILADPEEAKLPEETDRLYALCSALSEKYRGKRTKTVLEPLVCLCKRLPAEFSVLLMRMTYRHAASTHKADLAKMIRDAGLVEILGKYALKG